MADILSQEEIDKLLNATAGDAAPEFGGLSPSEVGSVEGITRVLFESAGATLASLIARPTTVVAGSAAVVDLTQLEVPKGFLLRFPFRSGFSGALVLFLDYEHAAALADLILGGEGEPRDPLEQADRDALRDAWSQAAAGSAPALTEALGIEVAFDAPQEEEVEQGELPVALPWGHALLGLGTVQVEGGLEAPVRALLTIGVAREMAHLVREPEPPPEPELREEPPPAAAEPAAPRGPAPDIRNIDLILDIEVDVMVRLGEAVMPIKEIQRLRPGSIIDLDKETDAPVDLVVNDKVIARGELVVVGSDHFALRITEIETPSERIRRLGP
ncbi:MAG: flagellar motor switch protein FliN [Deferrisomatales bacterium]